MYHRSRASTLEREGCDARGPRRMLRSLRRTLTASCRLRRQQNTQQLRLRADGGRGGLTDGQVCRLHSWRSRSQPAKTTPAPARDVIANSGRRPLALAHVSTTRSVTSAREVQVAFHGTLSVRFFIA